MYIALLNLNVAIAECRAQTFDVCSIGLAVGVGVQEESGDLMVSRVTVEGELSGGEVESHSSEGLQINEVNTELCMSHWRKR